MQSVSSIKQLFKLRLCFSFKNQHYLRFFKFNSMSFVSVSESWKKLFFIFFKSNYIKGTFIEESFDVLQGYKLEEPSRFEIFSNWTNLKRSEEIEVTFDVIFVWAKDTKDPFTGYFYNFLVFQLRSDTKKNIFHSEIKSGCLLRSSFKILGHISYLISVTKNLA